MPWGGSTCYEDGSHLAHLYSLTCPALSSLTPTRSPNNEVPNGSAIPYPHPTLETTPHTRSAAVEVY